jgi:dethiobiotin synthetase
MQHRTIFITGTDTGVGKTVLTAWLARRLCSRGISVAALKPICSGGRADARELCLALGGALALDEVNPWHFGAALAPLTAARRERKRVNLRNVLAHVRKIRRRCDVLLVEGAGGLLSPLGEGFNARDLIAALRALPVVVCPNRLGAVNQCLLVVSALPRNAARQAQIVLNSGVHTDAAALANRDLLKGELGAGRVHVLPLLPAGGLAARSPAVRRFERFIETLEERIFRRTFRPLNRPCL